MQTKKCPFGKNTHKKTASALALLVCADCFFYENLAYVHFLNLQKQLCILFNNKEILCLILKLYTNSAEIKFATL